MRLNEPGNFIRQRGRINNSGDVVPSLSSIAVQMIAKKNTFRRKTPPPTYRRARQILLDRFRHPRRGLLSDSIETALDDEALRELLVESLEMSDRVFDQSDEFVQIDRSQTGGSDRSRVPIAAYFSSTCVIEVLFFSRTLRTRFARMRLREKARHRRISREE